MKSNHRFCALALSAVLALTMTACSETAADSAASTATAPAEPNQSTTQQGVSVQAPTADQQTAVLGSLTSTELQELISGSTTLEQLTQQRAESTESASAAAPAEVPAYEQELQGLIDQLYAVKARAESSLNGAINDAKAEYKALPAAKQTQARKVAICMGKASELKAMEASCDKEVDNIVSQMRTLLIQNGQSTALADEAMAAYKAQKSEMISSLTSKLYG